MRFQKENTSFHPPPQLHPSNHKFSSSSSSSSSSQSVELPRKVGNLNHKKHLKQCKSMSLSKGKGKTHAVPDEFDLRSIENANRKQQSFYTNEAIIKEIVPKSSKRIHGGRGFKCSSFGMCLPGFGKAKPIKTRKIETKVDYSMNVMSSTFSISFENFDINAQGRIVRENNYEDDSISSYFELPSTAL